MWFLNMPNDIPSIYFSGDTEIKKEDRRQRKSSGFGEKSRSISDQVFLMIFFWSY